MESECNGWVKTMNLIHQYILVGLLLCFPINFSVAYFAKKSRFVVEKGIDGGKNGLMQVFRNISGGNGGPVFFI